jgi:hypothetical protein
MLNRVKVNAYQIALVMKNGVYEKSLNEGVYWLWNKVAYVYDRSKPFVAPVPIQYLLQDEALVNEIIVVQVADNEIVLQYEDGLLKQVLKAGVYYYWKTLIEYQFVKADISKIDIDASITKSMLEHPAVVPYVRTITVESYEQALLFVDGVFIQLLSPGMYKWWKNASAIFVARADMRQQQMEINGQEILTRDKAALRMNAWAQYKVVDAQKVILGNKDYERQLYVALQLTLREYVAGFSFDELLEKREGIAPVVLQEAAAKAALMGLEVQTFGIRDIILPGDIKEIMNQVLVAEKKAQANVIMRREETASTRSLMNTAKLMEENPVLWKLKEMEYVERIAEKISTISVGGNGALIEQLKQIFVNEK